MNVSKPLLCALLLTGAVGCQTYEQAREVRLVGFEENVSKGKSVGPIEGSDCVYQVLGYFLGGQPTLRKAVMNARRGKEGSLGDSFGGEGNGGGGGVRYFDNMAVGQDGFNAYVFGKHCITVSAVGYK